MLSKDAEAAMTPRTASNQTQGGLVVLRPESSLGRRDDIALAGAIFFSVYRGIGTVVINFIVMGFLVAINYCH